MGGCFSGIWKSEVTDENVFLLFWGQQAGRKLLHVGFYLHVQGHLVVIEVLICGFYFIYRCRGI